MKKFISFIILSLIINFITAQEKIPTLEDYLVNYTFAEKKAPAVKHLNDGQHYSILENNSRIVKFSYKTGERIETIFDINEIEDSPISTFSDYIFSNDESKILLVTDPEPIYRYSFTASYFVWNMVTEELIPLSSYGSQQLATFSPDGNRIAFVRDNNIFIKNLRYGTESQVTYDGEKNKIINGAPDWVYEEEFEFTKAFAWSPDSKFLGFMRFDESGVKEYNMALYKGQEPTFTENSIYPGQKTLKYPKAGEDNSFVSVHIYDIATKTTAKADIGDDSTQYIPKIDWVPDGNDLVVFRLNRAQNQTEMLYINPYTGDSRIILTEKNEKYIENSFFNKFEYLKDGEHFITYSEKNGYYQIYLYNIQGFEIKQVTQGDYDITDFYGYDPDDEIFYYQAAAVSPLQREVYFISMDEKKNGILSELTGTNEASFANTFEYFINIYSNINTPSLTSIYDIKGKQIRILEDYSELNQKLIEYRIQDKEFFSFTTSENIELNGWILKPVDFNQNNQYPLILTQYSGPDSQEVLDDYSIGWEYYLAQKGFIVACVDPRGTGARGEDFRKITYMQLGKYESIDLVEAAKYLGSLQYIDAQNIGIFGWSYGGFIVLMAMETGNWEFKAGIAVAPVTNWRFYNTIYTERYMQTPQFNPGGYDENTPFNYAENLKGNILLVHGTIDDNVHLQNTMEFSEKLVQAGIPFDQAIYTNRDHNIYGGNTQLHLYNKMVNYFTEHLK